MSVWYRRPRAPTPIKPTYHVDDPYTMSLRVQEHQARIIDRSTINSTFDIFLNRKARERLASGSWYEGIPIIGQVANTIHASMDLFGRMWDARDPAQMLFTSLRFMGDTFDIVSSVTIKPFLYAHQYGVDLGDAYSDILGLGDQGRYNYWFGDFAEGVGLPDNWALHLAGEMLIDPSVWWTLGMSALPALKGASKKQITTAIKQTLDNSATHMNKNISRTTMTGVNLHHPKAAEHVHRLNSAVLRGDKTDYVNAMLAYKQSAGDILSNPALTRADALKTFNTSVLETQSKGFFHVLGAIDRFELRVIRSLRTVTPIRGTRNAVGKLYRMSRPDMYTKITKGTQPGIDYVAEKYNKYENTPEGLEVLKKDIQELDVKLRAALENGDEDLVAELYMNSVELDQAHRMISYQSELQHMKAKAEIAQNRANKVRDDLGKERIKNDQLTEEEHKLWTAVKNFADSEKLRYKDYNRYHSNLKKIKAQAEDPRVISGEYKPIYKHDQYLEAKEELAKINEEINDVRGIKKLAKEYNELNHKKVSLKKQIAGYEATQSILRLANGDPAIADKVAATLQHPQNAKMKEHFLSLTRDTFNEYKAIANANKDELTDLVRRFKHSKSKEHIAITAKKKMDDIHKKYTWDKNDKAGRSVRAKAAYIKLPTTKGHEVLTRIRRAKEKITAANVLVRQAGTDPVAIQKAHQEALEAIAELRHWREARNMIKAEEEYIKAFRELQRENIEYLNVHFNDIGDEFKTKFLNNYKQLQLVQTIERQKDRRITHIDKEMLDIRLALQGNLKPPAEAYSGVLGSYNKTYKEDLMNAIREQDLKTYTTLADEYGTIKNHVLKAIRTSPEIARLYKTVALIDKQFVGLTANDLVTKANTITNSYYDAVESYARVLDPSLAGPLTKQQIQQAEVLLENQSKELAVELGNFAEALRTHKSTDFYRMPDGQIKPEYALGAAIFYGVVDKNSGLTTREQDIVNIVLGAAHKAGVKSPMGKLNMLENLSPDKIRNYVFQDTIDLLEQVQEVWVHKGAAVRDKAGKYTPAEEIATADQNLYNILESTLTVINDYKRHYNRLKEMMTFERNKETSRYQVKDVFKERYSKKAESKGLAKMNDTILENKYMQHRLAISFLADKGVSLSYDGQLISNETNAQQLMDNLNQYFRRASKITGDGQKIEITNPNDAVQFLNNLENDIKEGLTVMLEDYTGMYDRMLLDQQKFKAGINLPEGSKEQVQKIIKIKQEVTEAHKEVQYIRSLNRAFNNAGNMMRKNINNLKTFEAQSSIKSKKRQRFIAQTQNETKNLRRTLTDKKKQLSNRAKKDARYRNLEKEIAEKEQKLKQLQSILRSSVSLEDEHKSISNRIAKATKDYQEYLSNIDSIREQRYFFVEGGKKRFIDPQNAQKVYKQKINELADSRLKEYFTGYELEELRKIKQNPLFVDTNMTDKDFRRAQSVVKAIEKRRKSEEHVQLLASLYLGKDYEPFFKLQQELTLFSALAGPQHKYLSRAVSDLFDLFGVAKDIVDLDIKTLRDFKRRQDKIGNLVSLFKNAKGFLDKETYQRAVRNELAESGLKAKQRLVLDVLVKNDISLEDAANMTEEDMFEYLRDYVEKLFHRMKNFINDQSAAETIMSKSPSESQIKKAEASIFSLMLAGDKNHKLKPLFKDSLAPLAAPENVTDIEGINPILTTLNGTPYHKTEHAKTHNINIKEANFLFVDLETTGTNPELDEVWQLGYTRVDSAGERMYGNSYLPMKKHKDLPPNIKELSGHQNHKYHENLAKQSGDPIGEFKGLIDDNTIIVAYNSKFETGFMHQILGNDANTLANPVLDMLPLSRFAINHQRSIFKRETAKISKDIDTLSVRLEKINKNIRDGKLRLEQQRRRSFPRTKAGSVSNPIEARTQKQIAKLEQDILRREELAKRLETIQNHKLEHIKDMMLKQDELDTMKQRIMKNSEIPEDILHDHIAVFDAAVSDEILNSFSPSGNYLVELFDHYGITNVSDLSKRIGLFSAEDVKDISAKVISSYGKGIRRLLDKVLPEERRIVEIDGQLVDKGVVQSQGGVYADDLNFIDETIKNSIVNIDATYRKIDGAITEENMNNFEFTSKNLGEMIIDLEEYKHSLEYALRKNEEIEFGDAIYHTSKSNILMDEESVSDIKDAIENLDDLITKYESAMERPDEYVAAVMGDLTGFVSQSTFDNHLYLMGSAEQFTALPQIINTIRGKTGNESMVANDMADVFKTMYKSKLTELAETDPRLPPLIKKAEQDGKLHELFTEYFGDDDLTKALNFFGDWQESKNFQAALYNRMFNKYQNLTGQQAEDARIAMHVTFDMLQKFDKRVYDHIKYGSGPLDAETFQGLYRAELLAKPESNLIINPSLDKRVVDHLTMDQKKLLEDFTRSRFEKYVKRGDKNFRVLLNPSTDTTNEFYHSFKENILDPFTEIHKGLEKGFEGSDQVAQVVPDQQAKDLSKLVLEAIEEMRAPLKEIKTRNRLAPRRPMASINSHINDLVAKAKKGDGSGLSHLQHLYTTGELPMVGERYTVKYTKGSKKLTTQTRAVNSLLHGLTELPDQGLSTYRSSESKNQLYEAITSGLREITGTNDVTADIYSEYIIRNTRRTQSRLIREEQFEKLMKMSKEEYGDLRLEKFVKELQAYAMGLESPTRDGHKYASPFQKSDGMIDEEAVREFQSRVYGSLMDYLDDIQPASYRGMLSPMYDSGMTKADIQRVAASTVRNLHTANEAFHHSYVNMRAFFSGDKEQSARQMLNYLKQNDSKLRVVRLVPDAKNKTGMKMQIVKLDSTQDIHNMDEMLSTLKPDQFSPIGIVDTNTYQKMLQQFDMVFKFKEGSVPDTIRRHVLMPIKSSMLLNSAFVFTNMFDAAFKNQLVQEGGVFSPKNVIADTVTAMKMYKKYNRLWSEASDVIDLSQHSVRYETRWIDMYEKYLKANELWDEGMVDDFIEAKFIAEFLDNPAATSEFATLLRNAKNNYIGTGDKKGAFENAINTVFYGHKYSPFARNMQLNSSVELYSRLGLHLNNVKKGLTPEESLTKVLNTHYNYADKSIEEMYAEFVIPFMSFPIRSFMFWSDQLFSKPDQTKFLSKLILRSWGQDELNNNDYAEYQASRGRLPIGNYAVNFGLTYLDAATIMGGAHGSPIPFSDQALRKVNPIAKQLLEPSDRAIDERLQRMPIASQLTALNTAVTAGAAGETDWSKYLPATVAPYYGNSASRQFTNTRFRSHLFREPYNYMKSGKSVSNPRQSLRYKMLNIDRYKTAGI